MPATITPGTRSDAQPEATRRTFSDQCAGGLRVLLSRAVASAAAGSRLLAKTEGHLARAASRLDGHDAPQPLPPESEPSYQDLALVIRRLVDAHGDIENLAVLVYELLDAHDQTARLAADEEHDPHWRVHLDYLRDLQRVGRTILAHTAVESGRDSAAPRAA